MYYSEIIFLLEDNCFTILCWFLPYINMNQHRYTYVPSLLTLPLIFRPIPLSVGCHRPLGWSPGVAQQIPTGSLFYVRYCIYFHAALSVHPTFSLPHCAHKSVLCVCEGLEVSSLKNVLLKQEVTKVANTRDTGVNSTFLPSFHSFFFFPANEDTLHTRFWILEFSRGTLFS